MVEVQHVTKRYGSFTAVDDLSFQVERGEILGFLGPNGAGKTTTMRILTGYQPRRVSPASRDSTCSSNHSRLSDELDICRKRPLCTPR